MVPNTKGLSLIVSCRLHCSQQAAASVQCCPFCLQVFVRERDTCRECPYAFLSSTVFTSLPYLLVAACLTAIVLIPMAGLNSSGECLHFATCWWLPAF